MLGGLQESTATLFSISILLPLQSKQWVVMTFAFFVIFFHSVCTTSSTITSTWWARLLLQPGRFRGCLWFIWHSKPRYCISITWSHGILLVIHFTSTIVLSVKHAIQYGLKHWHACACDCSEVKWLGYAMDLWYKHLAYSWHLGVTQIMSAVIEKLCLECSFQMIEAKWHGLAAN